MDPRSPHGGDGVAGGGVAGGGVAGTVGIVVNGVAREVPAGSTARDVVCDLGLEGRPLAVEVNEAVVPRARLADCTLNPGDRLEIVTLVGGG
jgi:thiamine biosynthesis protein ThiS